VIHRSALPDGMTRPLYSPLDLARLLDSCSEGGSWNGSDVCDVLAELAKPGQVRCDDCYIWQAADRSTCIDCGEVLYP
jgi:hypothetical protein